ncbi:hypothetical protein FD755_002739 [Muntiacus reevesi]|uniref:Leptin receptor gene-related protein n=2 Tax=Muntiacus TaxID=9885 RepID=A0A5J5N782_MUNRE|nr:hypothetical protein FD754_004778 [Muntiacus muntjak]KAB0387783.1 hypothetical protein FD755_002739 [Muntiacus reevesi]
MRLLFGTLNIRLTQGLFIHRVNRAYAIKWGACGLVLAGNAVIFLTIQGFFLVFGRGDDFSWEQW